MENTKSIITSKANLVSVTKQPIPRDSDMKVDWESHPIIQSCMDSA